MRVSNLAKALSRNLVRVLLPHRVIAATLIAASGFWPGAQGNASEQRFITIGTAGVTGVYYPSGTAACKIVNLDRSQHGVRCSVESTLGSISNINQIRSGELDFGFAQSDWQHHAYLGTSVFEDEGPFEDLRSVLFLHPEIATIVVREGSAYRSLDDLKGARVDTGGSGSGSSASWSALVDDLGWSATDRQNFSNRNSSELAEALCSDEIDAYFQLIGHPAALIEETQGLCDIRLVGIDSMAVKEFVDEQPYYTAATIPSGLYQLSEPVGSFGVVATVVTSAEMPEEIVTALVAAVHENFDSFKTLHPALNRLRHEDLVLLDATAPLHPGALTYFESRGLLPLDGSKSAD